MRRDAVIVRATAETRLQGSIHLPLPTASTASTKENTVVLTHASKINVGPHGSLA